MVGGVAGEGDEGGLYAAFTLMTQTKFVKYIATATDTHTHTLHSTVIRRYSKCDLFSVGSTVQIMTCTVAKAQCDSLCFPQAEIIWEPLH